MSPTRTIALLAILCSATLAHAQTTYAVVDTGQTHCYNDTTQIQPPQPGTPYFGQDAQYPGLQPAYRDNGDGTVTDLNTDLMWLHDPGPKKTYPQALADAPTCRVAGHDDWRLPTIKELYSLILFSGVDPDPRNANTSQLKPFIDIRYFKFSFGDPTQGDRPIDSQYATSTLYRGLTMNGNRTMFGVNFADGRIKGYPIDAHGPRGQKKFYALYVRGNPDYGRNRFLDNHDGAITDRATGLMWTKPDSGHLNAGPFRDGRLNWTQALQWAENLEYAGYSDWRLPNAKELQSIVDYTRCPDVTDSPAIDPNFDVTPIANEAGRKDFPFYWTGTTHCRPAHADAAVYVAFGRSLGWMQFPGSWQPRLYDVHGAGAQRSDPKTGDPSRFPYGRGPQGDVIRIYNYARPVRTAAPPPAPTNQ